MNRSRLLQWLCGMLLIGCVPFGPAHAQLGETWVSHAKGSDSNDCSQSTPCASFFRTLTQTAAGGQINVMDAGDFGGVVINKSVTIVNDTSGTATTAAFLPCVLSCVAAHAWIEIAAGPTDVVTLRGLTVNNGNFANTYGIYVANARQVNIEKCTFRDLTSGVIVAPNAGSGTLASTINLNIDETIVTGSGSGVRVTSVPGVTVNASVSRSALKSNTGGGIRIDGSAGGTITALVRDTETSLNASNGIIAISGPGNVAVNVAHSYMASNGLYGVQSNQTNGGTATVTVNASTITNNTSGQVGVFGGAKLLTFGDNRLVGPTGTGFTGPIPLQ